MSLPSGMEINDRVDIDNRYLRVTCRTNSVASSQDLKMIAWANSWWKSSKYNMYLTGQVSMFASM
jgi:hypothetical protein